MLTVNVDAEGKFISLLQGVFLVEGTDFEVKTLEDTEPVEEDQVEVE